MNRSSEPVLFIIFGGTGDLAKKKLFTALYSLFNKNMLPENFAILSIGRKELSRAEYSDILKSSVSEVGDIRFDEKIWSSFQESLFYYNLEFSEQEKYESLDNYIKDLEGIFKTMGNRLYYFAVSPQYFSVIAKNLDNQDMINQDNGWKRVIIEKPFGKDLKTARKLNEELSLTFKEENTYRIDHYLGKEMIQNIMVIRFANAIFEPLWNSEHIDNIQIIVSEKDGVGSRGGYYDESGAIRDMVQNHLIQLLAIVTMEKPRELNSETIREEKVNIIKSIAAFNKEELKNNIVLGQYEGYKEEYKVKNDSLTETFVALKIFLDNKRWEGVPFYLMTGKNLKEKFAGIIIEFKENKNKAEKLLYPEVTPNLLFIKVQPEEGISLTLNAKKPGTDDEITIASMDFCQSCMVGYNSPQAYEKLLLDAVGGDHTRFTRWDEVEYAWKFVDKIINCYEKNEDTLEIYKMGSIGPHGARRLLEKDNRKWWKE